MASEVLANPPKLNLSEIRDIDGNLILKLDENNTYIDAEIKWINLNL